MQNPPHRNPPDQPAPDQPGPQAYTAAQVREAEAPFLDRGMPLMARAAGAVATEAATLLTARRGAAGGVRGARVLVLAGSGNNGADALFAARLLADQGAALCILPTSDRVHRVALEAALAPGADLRPVDERPEVVTGLARAADLILDGILGTGTTGNPALRGAARGTVAAILPALSGEHPPLVVAVDLPSGIGVDDGSVPDPTVLRADLTVTFGGCKAGLVLHPAADFAGRVVVADIGIGDELERIRRRDLA
ncbi:NAD(P)H-hydrate epimerase [Cryobacterium sp. SO1]|uniref:NAD(P)H-hydrate epimerase n=1 Tax=Cryobacterium sp. SO1 TaxID=1897061 RepID=UPI0010DA578C|nr:NAD(P)H-hydrate epimerase [Cryobacterium sp. SO1]RZI35062.1 Bifunctional NAD(P)H-hydrate repair enzyme Nnr [Cryobacterium sp. SO1]